MNTLKLARHSLLTIALAAAAAQVAASSEGPT